MYLYVGITPQTEHASWILGSPGGFGQPVELFGNNSKSPRHSGIAKSFRVGFTFKIFSKYNQVVCRDGCRYFPSLLLGLALPGLAQIPR